MRNITWDRGSAYNHGKVEGTDYRCERFWNGDADKKKHWYLLSDSKVTYLCCKGPFSTPEERDKEIIREVNRREKQKCKKNY